MGKHGLAWTQEKSGKHGLALPGERWVNLGWPGLRKSRVNLGPGNLGQTLESWANMGSPTLENLGKYGLAQPREKLGKHGLAHGLGPAHTCHSWENLGPTLPERAPGWGLFSFTELGHRYPELLPAWPQAWPRLG